MATITKCNVYVYKKPVYVCKYLDREKIKEYNCVPSRFCFCYFVAIVGLSLAKIMFKLLFFLRFFLTLFFLNDNLFFRNNFILCTFVFLWSLVELRYILLYTSTIYTLPLHWTNVFFFHMKYWKQVFLVCVCPFIFSSFFFARIWISNEIFAFSLYIVNFGQAGVSDDTSKKKVYDTEKSTYWIHLIYSLSSRRVVCAVKRSKFFFSCKKYKNVLFHFLSFGSRFFVVSKVER